MVDHARADITDRTLTARFSGNYSVEDFLGVFADAFADAETPMRLAVLIDSRAATVQRSAQELTRMLETFATWADRILCLAYVANTNAQYDVADQATALARFNQWDAKAFRDMEAARDWVADRLARSPSS